MDDLIECVAGLGEEGEKGALASLVWSSGSIPMSARAKMLVRSRDKPLGTIGGGCLEAEIIAVAREVLRTGRACMSRYTMTEEQAGEGGLNCGGSVRIFTEEVEAEPGAALYAEIARARAARRPCALATLLAEKPARMLCYPGGGRLGSLGLEEADLQVEAHLDAVVEKEEGAIVALDLEACRARALGVGEKGKVEVFLEPFLPPPVLYVFGGGHVGAQIGKMAKNVGFRVVVVDDRPLFASRERHPEVDECVVAEMEGAFEQLHIDALSFIVAATRGHQHDEVVIEQAIQTPACYIGMLGSERKKMIMWKRLEARGAARRRLDQVYAPIGLNIGSDTPAEIAVSVVAELIQVRRGARKMWKTKKSSCEICTA